MQKYALVVGNSEYQYLDNLEKSSNDVKAVGNILKSKGFEIAYAENLTKRNFKKILNNFYQNKTLKDIIFIYYSGHAINYNAINYLVPVDAEVNFESDIEDENISLDTAIKRLNNATNIFTMVIDGYKKNPFSNTIAHFTHQSISLPNGLKPIDIQFTNQYIIAYGAGIDLSTKSTQHSKYNLFTQFLLENMNRDNLKLDDIFKNSIKSLISIDKNYKPFVNMDIYDIFYLIGHAPKDEKEIIIKEKIVEKPVEKIVEKIIEKPVEKIVEIEKIIEVDNPKLLKRIEEYENEIATLKDELNKFKNDQEIKQEEIIQKAKEVIEEVIETPKNEDKIKNKEEKEDKKELEEEKKELEEEIVEINEQPKEDKPSDTIEEDNESNELFWHDTQTSLIWQKNINDKALSYQEAKDYITTLNDENYAGYSNWKIPSLEELNTILTDTALENENSFTQETYIKSQLLGTMKVEKQIFWSDTVSEVDNKKYWYVNFSNGLDGWANQDNKYHIIAVCNK
jgi:hypothetical protein